MIYGVIAALLIQSAMHIYVSHVHKKQWMRHMESKESEWHAERQQLLDRIQAPSFDHLKQAEIRVIKAQKEEPPVKYELV